MWPFRTSHVYLYEDLAARYDKRGEHKADYFTQICKDAGNINRPQFAATNTAHKNEGSEKEGATATIIVVTMASARYNMPSRRDSSAGYRYQPE